MYGTTAFKTLCTRHKHKPIYLRETGNKWSEPYLLTPAYCLKRPSKATVYKVEPRRSLYNISSWDRAESPERPRWQEFTGQNSWTESSMERELQTLANGPLFQHIAVYQSGQCTSTWDHQRITRKKWEVFNWSQEQDLFSPGRTENLNAQAIWKSP